MDSLASQWWLGQPPRLGLLVPPPPRFLASGEVGGLQRIFRRNLSGIYLTGRWSLDRAVPSSRSKGCTVMERDREQLEKKLDLCRRLSGAASDPATSTRLAKIIEELEHSLRETEYLLGAS
jgi:hypothetical protein